VAQAHRRAHNALADQHAAGLDTAPIQRFQHGQDLAPSPMTRAPHQIASGVQALYETQKPS
jgi:hypothetical protein